MFFNLLTSPYLYDVVEPIAKWVSVGFVLALVLSWFITFLVKREIHGKVAKNNLLALFFYALVMGIFLLTLEIIKKYDSNYLENNYVNGDIVGLVFLPVLITLVVALVGGITAFIMARKKSSAVKPTIIITSIICGLGLFATLITIAIYYSKNIVGDGYYTGEYGKLNSVALYVGAGLLIATLVGLSFIVGKNNKKPFDTKTVATAGIYIAISFVLSYVKFEAAWLQGGSITLVSFLPICLFSFCYGMKKGLIVGLIYGLLQAVQDPWLIHPAQFLLDYPIAFSTIAFSGLLTDLKVLNNHNTLKFCLGVGITGVFRYIAHTLSGVFAFGAYAVGDGASNFLVYSLVYNSYVFIDIALVIIASIVIMSSKAFCKELCKINPTLNEK